MMKTANANVIPYAWKQAMKRFLLLFLVFCILPCCASLAEAPLAESRTLITEDVPGMRYDCVFFRNAWPEDILTAMTECFPDDAPIRGVYYIWRTITGAEIPIVFASCGSGDRMKLTGAWYFEDQWNSQVISDRFFRSEQEFDIVMKQEYTMAGLVKAYLPAVAYDGEWFAFYPGKSGFTFANYERERGWAVDCPEGAHMVAEIWNTVLNGTPERVFVVYSSLIGHGKTEIWRGTILQSFDTEMLDTSVFPVTLEDIMACCEPSG